MGHTNTTPNYNLPQFLGSDKPAWLTDVNNAMSAIDTAIAAAKAAADNAGGAAAALATTVGGHTTQLETLSNTVTTQGTTIVSQGNSINTIQELIGNGTPTTTNHTLIGAINELHANQGDLTNLTTTDKTSLVAAINEAAQGGGGTGTWALIDSVSSTGTDSSTAQTKVVTVPANVKEFLIRLESEGQIQASTIILPTDTSTCARFVYGGAGSSILQSASAQYTSSTHTLEATINHSSASITVTAELYYR